MIYSKVITYTATKEAIQWTDVAVIPPRIIQLLDESNESWGSDLRAHIIISSRGARLKISGEGRYDHMYIEFELGDWLIVGGHIETMDDIEAVNSENFEKRRERWEADGWTLNEPTTTPLTDGE